MDASKESSRRAWMELRQINRRLTPAHKSIAIIKRDDPAYLPASTRAVRELRDDLVEMKGQLKEIQELLSMGPVGLWRVASPAGETGPPGTGNEFPMLPPSLAPVAQILRESHQVVNLPPDWDGEGGKVCTEETWGRAASIVVHHTRIIWEQYSKVIPPHRIIPDLEGGIDVHWRRGPYELLLNVPDDASEPVTFFGNHREKYKSCKTSGELEADNTVNAGVLVWLAQMP